MADVVIEPVEAVRRAEIDRPAARRGADAPRDGTVGHVGREFGQVPKGVDLGPVPPAEARAIHGAASVPVAGAPAEAVTSEAVELGGAALVQRQPKVHHRHHVFLEPVAPVVIGLRHGVPLDDDLAVDDRVGDTGAGVFIDVGPGAIGRLPVEELGEQAERAAADSDAPPAVQIDRRTVVGIVGGMVAADARVQEGRELPFLEHQVHNTGDRSTSMRSIALEGIALRSTPLEPAPVPYANVLTSAVWWRRQPFTSTSV